MNYISVNPNLATVSVPTTGSPPLDMSLGAFVAVVTAKFLDRGFSFFAHKDATETELTTALINDIRLTNQTLVAVLPEMKSAIQQTNEAIREVRQTVDRISGTYSNEIQQIRRANMEAIVEMRAQQKEILDQLKAMRLVEVS